MNVVELWALLWMRPILHCFLWEPMWQEWHLDVKILISTFQLIQSFGCNYSILLSKKKSMNALSNPLNAHQIRFSWLLAPKTLQNGIFLKIGGVCPRFLVSHCSNDISTCFFCILGLEHIEVINGEQVVWIGSSMVSEWEVNILPFSKDSRRSKFVTKFWRDIFFPILYRSWQRNQFKVVISYII